MLRDDGLISLLMKPFVSHQRAIKCCQRYIISMIDFVPNLRLCRERDQVRYYRNTAVGQLCPDRRVWSHDLSQDGRISPMHLDVAVALLGWKEDMLHGNEE